MTKVKLELGKKNAAEKVDLGNKVVTQMTGNPNFTNPNPALDVVSAAVNNVSAASSEVEAARKLVQTKMSILGQYEGVLDSSLSQLAAYVENISNGDEAIILSSGMDVQKERSSPGLPGKVSSVTATASDNSGQIDLSWEKVTNAKSYVIEISVSGATPEWKIAQISTKSKAEVPGLQTGTSYQIRIAAVGSAGQGPYSDPVVKVAP